MTVQPSLHEVTVECDCHTERIVLTWDTSVNWGPFIEMAFWRMGQHASHGWRGRIRHIWRIVRTGSPYSDFVALDPASARELSDGLALAAREIEGRERVSV